MKLRDAWRLGGRLILGFVWRAAWLGGWQPATASALVAEKPVALAPASGRGEAPLRGSLTATVTPASIRPPYWWELTTLEPPGYGTPILTTPTPRPTATPLPSATPCKVALNRLYPPAIPADRSLALTLTGSGFAPRSILHLGEALTLTTTYISSTLATAVVPPGLASGIYPARLTTSAGCEAVLADAVRVAGPQLAALTLNGGALTTAVPTITVGLPAATVPVASKIVGMSFSDDGVVWAPWTDYAVAATRTLPRGEGPHTVYARGVDWVGNVSPVVSATITVDPAAAAFMGVIINQGQYFAHAITTTLALGAKPGTAQMQLSNRADFAGAKWEPYALHKSWVMPPSADSFTPSWVYVRYKDVRGRASPAYQASILVDAQAPEGGVSVAAMTGAGPGGSLMPADIRSYSFDESRFLRLGLSDLEKAGIYLPLPRTGPETAVMASAACPTCPIFRLDLPAQDDLSGVGAVRLSSEPSFSGAQWELYTVKKLWPAPPAGGTVYVEYRDFAGNISPVYTATLPAAPALDVPRHLPNHLGTEKVVLADYMMWYSPSNFNGLMTWDVPVAGPYDSGDPAIIRKQVSQTQLACLDGLAAHWYGPTDATTTKNFEELLRASAGTALRHAIVIQTNILPGANEAMIVDAINYVTLHWAQDPHYLRLGGRPLLIFTDIPRPWDDPLKALEGWQRIRQATDPGHAMIWMAEGLYPNYNPLFDGLYIYRIDHRDYEQGWLQQPRWAKGLRDLEQKPGVPLPLGGLYFADSISPGFDNTRLANSPVNFSAPAPEFARDRRDGGYYADTFAVTAQTGGDFMLVKSFNEWIEGTEIEPGLTYGDLYLNLTCQYATIYRGR